MKSRPHKRRLSRRSWLLIITTICIVVLLACTAAFFRFDQPASPQKNDDATSHNNTESKSNDQSQKPAPQADQTTQRESEKNLPKNENGTAPMPQSASGLSLHISHKSITNGTLVLRSTIQQQLASGSCTLTLTQGNRVITKKADIIQNPTSSTCMGFDVPTTELGSGRWGLTLYVAGGGKTGSVTDSVEL